MNTNTVASIFILFAIVMSREGKQIFEAGGNTHLGTFQWNYKPFGEKHQEEKTKEKKKLY